jgi:hypothetical protein
MTQPFDYDTFCSRSMDIMVHSEGKHFPQLAEEIAALQKDYGAVRDTAAKKFIKRNLSRRLLEVAIDTCQPRVVVDKVYSRTVQQGFNDLHAEVAAVIEYAKYCQECGDPTSGIQALQQATERIRSRRAISLDHARTFLRAIDAALRRLRKDDRHGRGTA